MKFLIFYVRLLAAVTCDPTLFCVPTEAVTVFGPVEVFEVMVLVSCDCCWVPLSLVCLVWLPSLVALFVPESFISRQLECFGRVLCRFVSGSRLVTLSATRVARGVADVIVEARGRSRGGYFLGPRLRVRGPRGGSRQSGRTS